MIASEFAEKMDSAGVFIVALIVVMVVSAAWNEFATSDKYEASVRQENSDASDEPQRNVPDNATTAHEATAKSKQDFAGHNSFDSRSNTFKLRHDDADQNH